jgi:DNA repair exonuclease SbcCD ATPase subunit
MRALIGPQGEPILEDDEQAEDSTCPTCGQELPEEEDDGLTELQA